MPKTFRVTPRPEESERPVRTLYLDFEGPEAPDASPRAFEVYRTEDGEITGESPLVPDEVTASSGVIRASFREPIERGTYRVVVRPGPMSFRGGPVDLMEGPGNPFSGWELRVLAPARGNVPEPDLREAKENPPSPRVFGADGRELQAGATEIKGESLRVTGEDPHLSIVALQGPLVSGEPGPFSDNMAREDHPDGGSLFYSQSLGAPSFRWAVYPEEKIGIPPAQNLLPALQRRPKPVEDDPLFDLSYETATPEGHADHPNSYERARLKRRTESSPEWTEGTTYVYPTNIVDSGWTPQSDPHLFPNDHYLTRRPEPEDAAVALSLPINCRLDVKNKGKIIWQGLTRLVPMLATVEEARQEGLSGSDMDLSVQLWEASQQALAKWKGPLPGRPPATMREFVLCRAKLGAAREEGFQGRVSSSEGDVTISGQSARHLRSRLQALSRQLKAGEKELPLFPEDRAVVGHARPSSSHSRRRIKRLNRRHRK